MNIVNGRLNCRDAVNLLQCCQTRFLSVESQKLAPSADKSKQDIPNPGSSESNNTVRNILIGVGILAIGAGVYYVSYVSLGGLFT